MSGGVFSSHRPTAPQRDGCEAHFGWGVTAPERRTAGGARALTIPRPAACRRRPEARERVRRAGRVHGDSTEQYLYTAVHARGSRPPAILHRTAPTHRPYRCTPSCTVHSRRATPTGTLHARWPYIRIGIRTLPIRYRLHAIRQQRAGPFGRVLQSGGTREGLERPGATPYFYRKGQCPSYCTMERLSPIRI